MSSDATSEPDADRAPDSFDVVVSALLNEQARRVVEFFQISGEQVVSRDALVDHLHDMTETADDREQVAIRLTHVTLPKLDDVGLVEYDRQSHTVRYREPPLPEWVSAFLTLREEAI
ncbi:DUF7344 domain-containing protein [Halomicrobium urmianum]|uniref:DUF7344 domain-containing protein n=1 Tax=Halomicrobium urmianum TaxID=1586233 RepID=UPI001CD96F75|nr:hypothetical protein [Halomicrobium urmianum]